MPAPQFKHAAQTWQANTMVRPLVVSLRERLSDNNDNDNDNDNNNNNHNDNDNDNDNDDDDNDNDNENDLHSNNHNASHNPCRPKDPCNRRPPSPKLPPDSPQLDLHSLPMGQHSLELLLSARPVSPQHGPLAGCRA